MTMNPQGTPENTPQAPAKTPEKQTLTDLTVDLNDTKFNQSETKQALKDFLYEKYSADTEKEMHDLVDTIGADEAGFDKKLEDVMTIDHVKSFLGKINETFQSGASYMDVYGKFRKATTMAVQMGLKILGYDIGAKQVDGQRGPATAKAIQQFESIHGLTLDGGYAGKEVISKIVALLAVSPIVKVDAAQLATADAAISQLSHTPAVNPITAPAAGGTPTSDPVPSSVADATPYQVTATNAGGSSASVNVPKPGAQPPKAPTNSREFAQKDVPPEVMKRLIKEMRGELEGRDMTIESNGSRIVCTDTKKISYAVSLDMKDYYLKNMGTYDYLKLLYDAREKLDANIKTDVDKIAFEKNIMKNYPKLKGQKFDIFVDKITKDPATKFAYETFLGKFTNNQPEIGDVSVDIAKGTISFAFVGEGLDKRGFRYKGNTKDRALKTVKLDALFDNQGNINMSGVEKEVVALMKYIVTKKENGYI